MTWKKVIETLKPKAPLLLSLAVFGILFLAAPAHAQTVTTEALEKAAPLICTIDAIARTVIFRLIALVMVLIALGYFVMGESRAAKGLLIVVAVVMLAVLTFRSWQSVFTGARIETGTATGATIDADGTPVITCER